jgi:tripeptide aminopeptidase
MSLQNYIHTVAERFMRYAQIDTEADPNSETQPSSEKQKDLSRLLVDELIAMGISDAELDQYGYVYATIPATIDKNVPVLCFCSHVDTAPDVTGANVKPVLHKKFDGSPILFADDTELSLSMEDHPYLKERLGDDIITASGKTLLGADDKAGVAIIMDLAAYLIKHPEVPHGKIRILFTPDEEIGRGAHHFDVDQFGADWAYTMDGSQVGELEYENFNAAGAKITFRGKSVHPGYAKGKMINSMLIANEFINTLPKGETPEETRGYEGFFHVHHLCGSIEESVVELIIRDHNKKKFEKRKALIAKITQKINKKYAKQFGEDIAIAEINDQYYNMKEKVLPVKHIVDIAEQAMRDLGIKPLVKPEDENNDLPGRYLI